MTERERRAALNENLYRHVNEQIEELNERLAATGGRFVCECADPACGATLELTLQDYEAVRAHGARFFVAPGHEQQGVERIVERHERFLVVEKMGDGRELAEELDPRDGAD